MDTHGIPLRCFEIQRIKITNAKKQNHPIRPQMIRRVSSQLGSLDRARYSSEHTLGNKMGLTRFNQSGVTMFMSPDSTTGQQYSLRIGRTVSNGTATLAHNWCAKTARPPERELMMSFLSSHRSIPACRNPLAHCVCMTHV